MDLLTTSLLHFYRTAQGHLPNVLFQGNGSRREIALTFDDGPHPLDTPRLLDVLAKHGVLATFHVVGKSAERHPDLIKQVHACGHQIALHCYRHVPFPLERTSVLRAQLGHTRDFIADVCGMSPETIRDLRPPYGATTRRTRSLLTKWGYRLVLWNCIPPHWMQPLSWSIRQIQDSLVPGGVIALHDGHGHGSKVAQIVGVIIPHARSLGFDFVTVESMWNQRNQAPAG